jgi:hypothetical protein
MPPKKEHIRPAVSAPDPRFNLADPRFSEIGRKKGGGDEQVDGGKPAQEVDTRFLRDFDAVPLKSHQQQQQRKRKRKPVDSNAEAPSALNDDFDHEVSNDATAAGASIPLMTSVITKQKKPNESIHERLDRLSRMSRGEIDIDEGGNASSSSEDEEDEEEEEEDEKKGKRDKGDDDDDDDGDEEEMLAREVDGPIVVQDPEAPDLADAEHTTMEGEETSRLALVNCDWSELRAVDIFATLQSFVPKGRALFKVQVYLSDYGMKRLAEETRSGPMSIFASSSTTTTTTIANTSDNAEEDDEKKKKKRKVSKVIEIGQPKGGRKKKNDDGEEGEEFDPERLRQYELNRMKYYFAIATFDSPSAASAVYNACDGMEFEASSNVFDLRFVPDDQNFDKHPQRDEASSIPLDYAPPIFATSALQSSKVELTWDGDDSARSRALDWDRVKDPESSVSGTGKARSKKKKGGREAPTRHTDLNDLSAYLASSESDDDDEEIDEEENLKKKKKSEKERRRLRALLLGESSKSKSHTEKNDDDDDDDEEEEEEEEDAEEGREMTITYDPNRVKSASDILVAKAEREAKEGESAWETYLRKRKEKKKAKKEAYKLSSTSTYKSSDPLAKKKSGMEDSASSSSLKDDAFFASSSSASNINEEDEDEESGTTKKNKKTTKKKGSKSTKNEEDEDMDNKSSMPVDDEKLRAQLELQALGQDDSGDEDGQNGSNFSLRRLMKAQKAMSGKGSKKDIAAAMEKKSKGVDNEDFNVNVTDPRFAAAFARDRPDFSIDPTSAAYKDTAGMRKILATRMEDATMSNTDGDKKKKRVMVVTQANPVGGAGASSTTTSTSDLAKRVQEKFSKKN